MVPHEALRLEISDHLGRLLKRTSELKVFLAFTQTADLNVVGWLSGSRDARALAVICTMAELESLVKTTVQRTHEELNTSSIPLKLLIPSVRQVVAHADFESLRAIQDHAKMWDKRWYTTTLERCGDFAKFPVEKSHPQPPLDGRTLKPEHFFRLWQIYSLPDAAFPDQRWPGALQKMALIRNDIAHGSLPYHEIFQHAGRDIPDIEKYVTHIESFAGHFTTAWSRYLREELYLMATSEIESPAVA